MGKELKKRKSKGSERCVLCGVPKSVNHILFQCTTARFVWTYIREAMLWDNRPGGMSDFLENWLPLGSAYYNLNLFIFGTITWVLWTNRNKMSIEKRFICEPTDIQFKMAFFTCSYGEPC